MLMAWCKLEFKVYTEALSLAQAAIKINPENTASLYVLALAESHCGYSQKALSTARQGIELDPENDELHGLLGDLVFNMGRPKQALPHYREALKNDPENARLLANFAQACAVTGDIPSAIDSFLSAAKLDPQDDGIRQKLFSILHHHLLNVPPPMKKEIIDQLGPNLSLFYESALDDKSYSNSLRLPSVVLLWIVVLFGMVFLISLATGEDISRIGGVFVIALSVYALLQLWQWLANWRLQKKYFSER